MQNVSNRKICVWGEADTGTLITLCAIFLETNVFLTMKSVKIDL